MEFTSPLVLITDFGLHDRFVASMKGVVFQVSPQIPVFDLTHQVTPFHVLEAADMLAHTLPYWPSHAIFVAVVDPGVGTSRKALALRGLSGQTLIAPDNGLGSYALASQGIQVVREIDPVLHRRPGSENYHTFHGRDLFVYVAARLAAGLLSYETLGHEISTWETLTVPKACTDPRQGLITGTVIRAERPYGNLVTNIPTEMARPLLAENTIFTVTISQSAGGQPSWQGQAVFHTAFGKVSPGEVLLYPDSNGCLGMAINQGNMAEYTGLDKQLREAPPLSISTLHS
jgi:S-adenosylmethionine hydrolase